MLKDGEEDFFTKHFKELARLKDIFLSKTIDKNDIRCFFDTDIFNLITADPRNFSVTLSDIYDFLIQDINLYTKNDFNLQCQILLDKKTKEGKDFNFDIFYSVLCDKRQKFKQSYQAFSANFYSPPKSSTPCNKRIQYVFHNSPNKL